MDKLIRNYDFRSLTVSLPYFKISGAHHCRDVTAANIPDQKYSFVFKNVASKMFWKGSITREWYHALRLFSKNCICIVWLNLLLGLGWYKSAKNADPDLGESDKRCVFASGFVAQSWPLPSSVHCVVFWNWIWPMMNGYFQSTEHLV
jgi:hypothetical protein